MKNLLVVGCLFLSSSAIASAVNTKKYICKDLQAQLETEGQMYVRYGLFGLGRRYTYSKQYIKDKKPCALDELKIQTLVKSKDKRYCTLGFSCTRWQDASL